MKRQTNSRDNLEMEGETGERNAEEFSSPHEEQRSLTTMVGVHVKKPIF